MTVDQPMEPDLQALLRDMRAIGDAAPTSGAKNRAGHAYRPTYYLRAVERAAAENRLVERVREWLHSAEPQDGFNALVEVGRGDLTVEALVLDTDKPYASRFTDADRAAAHARVEPFRQRERDLARQEEERRERMAAIKAGGRRLALPELDEHLRSRRD
jgi:hypothetical protein